MKQELVFWLICPWCYGDIIFEALNNHRIQPNSEIIEGTLRCGKCSVHFPITKSIPRFVASDNYSKSFGFQWNIFRKTQLDSFTNTTISRDRFCRQWGNEIDKMKGAMVLDAGCGAGRFSEIALSAGATVIAIDYSDSVDACWENLKDYPNLHVLQADVYTLPFREEFFDFVYSFGVLQHTPDVKSAFFSLAKKVKKNGKMCVDVYKKDWRIYLWPKYWLRPFTKRLPLPLLFEVTNKLVPLLLPLSTFLSKFPKIGRYLKYIVPVANYHGLYPLSRNQHMEWSILDTFDMLSPEYDLPQNRITMERWFCEAGFRDVKVIDQGLIFGRGVKQ